MQPRYTLKQTNAEPRLSNGYYWRIVTTNQWGDVVQETIYRTVNPVTTGDMNSIIRPHEDSETCEADFFYQIFGV